MEVLVSHQLEEEEEEEDQEEELVEEVIQEGVKLTCYQVFQWFNQSR